MQRPSISSSPPHEAPHFIFQDQGGADTLVSVKEEGGSYRAALIIGVAASGEKRAENSLMLKIVSGGQTGVDRAALDTAIERGIAYGGWCPKGGWAKDMPDPPGLLSLYPNLRETPEADPSQRTEWNVRDTGRLMVLIDSAGLAVSKGTGLAIGTAKKLGKPNIVIDMDADGAGVLAMGFVGEGQGPSALCIAGPRESEAPGIYAKTRAFLGGVLRLLIVTSHHLQPTRVGEILRPAACATTRLLPRILWLLRGKRWLQTLPRTREIIMVESQWHRYEDGPTTCRPSPAVLKSIQQSIKKSRALSAADVRLASYMGLIAAIPERPTGFNDGVFYPPGEAPLSLAPANRPLRAARMARSTGETPPTPCFGSHGRFQRQQGIQAAGRVSKNAVRSEQPQLDVEHLPGVVLWHISK